MRYQGEALVPATGRPYVLPRPQGEPLPLLLRPLPLGFQSRLRKRGVVLPVPPMKIARDSQGKPLRDGQGQVVTFEDRQNSEFLNQLEQYHQRVAVLAVFASVASDDNLSFEAAPPASDSAAGWPDFADRLFDEFEAAGFTAGDLVLLCREVGSLSNLIEGQLKRAEENFSPWEATTGP